RVYGFDFDPRLISHICTRCRSSSVLTIKSVSPSQSYCRAGNLPATASGERLPYKSECRLVNPETSETRNREMRRRGNQSPTAADSLRDGGARRHNVHQFFRSVFADN